MLLYEMLTLAELEKYTHPELEERLNIIVIIVFFFSKNSLWFIIVYFTNQEKFKDPFFFLYI